jgi:hypothetical protein
MVRIRLLERRSGWMRFAATANKRRIFVIMAQGSSQGWWDKRCPTRIPPNFSPSRGCAALRAGF